MKKQGEPTVICGRCGKRIIPVKIHPPRAVCEWDIASGITRDISFNCCGRTWLIDAGTRDRKTIDCGPEIVDKRRTNDNNNI